MAAITIRSDFGALKNKVCHCFHCMPYIFAMRWWDQSEWPSSKKSTNNICWRGCGEKGILLHCGWECKSTTAPVENSMDVLSWILKAIFLHLQFVTLVFDFSKLAFCANFSPRPSPLNLISGWGLPQIWSQLGLSLVIWTSFPAPSPLSSRKSVFSLFFWWCFLVTKLLSESFVTPWTVACQSIEGCRLLCPWDSPDKNTGMGCHFLFQDIFPNPGIKPTPPALQADYLPLSHLGSLFLFHGPINGFENISSHLNSSAAFSGFFFFLPPPISANPLLHCQWNSFSFLHSST